MIGDLLGQNVMLDQVWKSWKGIVFTLEITNREAGR